MNCSAHPHRTDGEVKCIGLSQREGQSHEDAYAEWTQLRRGERCTCDLSGFFVLADAKLPHGVGVCATYKVYDGCGAFTVEVVATRERDGKPWYPTISGAIPCDSKEEALAEFEAERARWAQATLEEVEAEIFR